VTPFRGSPEFLREREISEARERAYESFVSPWMNRAARRTAKGRMLVAQAEAAALKAELEVVRRHLDELTI
jgi:hypothetical protein